MTEAQWLRSTDPWRMLDPDQHPCSTRRMGLWAAGCCRRLWHRLPGEYRELLEAAEAAHERTDYLVGVVGESVLRRFGPTAHWAGYNPLGIDGPSAVACAAVSQLAGQFYKLAAGKVADALAGEETGVISGSAQRNPPPAFRAAWAREQAFHAALLRDVVGNPFRPVAFDPAWRSDTAVLLARGMYESRDFGAMPILADALQDAGCEDAEVREHCRGDGPHARGCWVIDLVLGKAWPRGPSPAGWARAGRHGGVRPAWAGENCHHEGGIGVLLRACYEPNALCRPSLLA